VIPPQADDAQFSVFICYRRSDARADAGRLYDALARRFGRHHLFMDVDDIHPGQDWTLTVEEAIRSSDVVLALIGPTWLTTTDSSGKRRLDDPADHVRRELETALRLGKPTIPVLFEDAQMPSDVELPGSLRDLTKWQAIRLSHASYRGDLQALVRSLRKLEGPRAERKTSQPAQASLERTKAVPAPSTTSKVVHQTTERLPAMARIAGGLFAIVVLAGVLVIGLNYLGGGRATPTPSATDVSNVRTSPPDVTLTPYATPTNTTAPAGPGLVAYITTTEVDPGTLILINPLTGTQTQLVAGSSTKRVTAAAFARDGNHIAYALAVGDPAANEIWTAKPDGSGASRIVEISNPIYGMDWAPDGTTIVFSASNGLSIVTLSNGSVRQLTNDPSKVDSGPAWSPSGDRIAFSRAANDELGPLEGSRIWTIGPDGSNPHPLREEGSTSDDNPAWSPDGTKIAFDSWPGMFESGSRDVYVTSSEGTGLTRLTTHPAEDLAAHWSPDGSEIAFVTSRGVDPAIYLMAADGSNQRSLVSIHDQFASIRNVGWGNVAIAGGAYVTASPTSGSPAATISADSLAGLGRIAFLEWMEPSDPLDETPREAVIVMDADGSNRERLLLNIVEGNELIADLAFSPDGKQLAINLLGDDSGPVWVVNADGSLPRRIADGAHIGVSWSPDGSHLAFTKAINDGPFWRAQIAIANVATGVIEMLPLEDDALALGPTWSPDGRQIAFVKEVGHDPNADQVRPPELWVSQADGSNSHSILTLSAIDGKSSYIRDPVWSPDGTRIAFVGSNEYVDLTSNIYVTNAQGTTLAQLTTGPGNNSEPSWSPDSRFLVFSSNRNYQNELFVMRSDGSAPTQLTNTTHGSSQLATWGPHE